MIEFPTWHPHKHFLKEVKGLAGKTGDEITIFKSIVHAIAQFKVRHIE